MNSCIDPSIKKCDDLKCTDFTPLSAAGGCPSTVCGVCEGICVTPEFAGPDCDPARFDQATCQGCQISGCSWNFPVVLGVSDSNPYCLMSSSPLKCESPPTCNGININQEVKEIQCRASGCRYDQNTQLCQNQDCFYFFLVGFVLQPVALTAFGLLKDIVVLLLIGVVGDKVMRGVKRKIVVPFRFWKHGWDRKRIIPNLDRTIYVNDSKCRDETSERNESFEKYCERIITELFIITSSNNEKNNSNNVEEREHEADVDEENEGGKIWKLKSQLLAAVTFSMYDSGLWFDLDNDGFSAVKNAPIQLGAYLDLMLDQDQRDENDNSTTRYVCTSRS